MNAKISICKQGEIDISLNVQAIEALLPTNKK
jgi:hypothetical protein